jgi:hypothetical protein
MGRYYSGDIEGKFMFAVQPSNAGERFGAEEQRDYVNYYVNKKKSYDHIVEELNKIEATGAIKRVQAMFDKSNCYNDEIMEENGVSSQDLAEYADWRLGKQIKDWFDENPDELYCDFTAEL